MTDEAAREAALRALPSVDRLAAELAGVATEAEAVAVARAVLAQRRAELLAGHPDDPGHGLAELARAQLRPSLRRVLNATGVVLHTNLGRAPLPAAALDALATTAGGATNLELDLETGQRGGRDDHAGRLLCELTGAQDALVVNNGAAAALLAATALGGPGTRIVVSRGQLVEIGGGFRVPDVVAQSGARLVEVGTTNRTRIEDYAAAIDPDEHTVLMRVHPSNFRILGFTSEVAIEPLVALGVPVIDDVGSGNLAEDLPALAGEPSVRRSVRAGVGLTCFSGDKLLGGPQAGILLGTQDAVALAQRHPLARALRASRLTLAALEATLRLYRDPARARSEIPVLAMLDVPAEELRARAARIAQATGGEVVDAIARVGGGALPLAELPGPAVALPGNPETLAARLRATDPPLLGRIHDGRLLMDPRTLHGPGEVDEAIAVLHTALDHG